MQSPPIDLLDELINRAVMRRQPGLRSVIDCISGIVRELPQLFSEKQTEYLIIALQYLIKDTELPNKKDLYKIRNPLISIDKLPIYRESSAKLSYWVFQKLRCENKEIPPIIFEWKEACLKDPFPQVRKVWTQ